MSKYISETETYLSSILAALAASDLAECFGEALARNGQHRKFRMRPTRAPNVDVAYLF
jgi:hypothetical protein